MPGTKIENEELKRYLFAEMSAGEREEIEDRFFIDEELFFEIMDFENRLIDLYARGKLTGEDLSRFEKSLDKCPERRRKVFNAGALQAFIEDEKRVEAPVRQINQRSFWSGISDYFGFRTLVFGSMAVSLLFIFVFGVGLIALIYQNQSRFDRERTAATPFESNKKTSATPLPNFTRTPKNPADENEINWQPETEPQILRVDKDAEIIILKIILPFDTAENQYFSIRLNGETIKPDVKPETDSRKRKFVRITSNAANLIDGSNVIAIVSESTGKAQSYEFTVIKQ